ncbi:MAG TPA: hypothetical protein VFM09_14820 [Marmoricola sp.]|nr:hypothetical protein [Marmoricola sp.]
MHRNRLRSAATILTTVTATASALALAVGIAPAHAVYVPPPTSGNCSNKAVAKYSYVAATSGKATGEYLTTSEIKGVGCYWRSSPSTAKVEFHWGAIGRLDSAGMRVQLRDCTAGDWAHQANLSYDNGTPKGVTTGSMPEKTWSLKPRHKYRLQIWGTGSYRRQADGTSGGIGYFYAAAQNKKHWKAWGGTGCS